MIESIRHIDIPEISHLDRMLDDDISRYVDCCAAAYATYPLTLWMVGGNTSYKKQVSLWKANLQTLRNQALIYSVSSDGIINGNCIWLPEGFSGVSSLSFLLHGGMRILPYASRLSSYEKYTAELKTRLTNNKCLYLYSIAVRPGKQGIGLATALLQPMMDYLDRVGKDCYLETHLQVNVGLYERFGFQLTATGKVPDSQLTHYAMLRHPQTDKRQSPTNPHF